MWTGRHFAGRVTVVEMVPRGVNVEFVPGRVLPCCTPEDVIIMKAFASRSGDCADVQNIVSRQTELDKDFIIEHFAELVGLKEEPEILERVRKIQEMRQ